VSGAWDGFTPEGSVQWGLGDYDRPDLVFNGIDANGVEWICALPQGWNTSSLDTPVVEGAGDGGWFAPGRRKTKPLTLTGAFRGDPSKVEAAADQLRSAAERLVSDTTIWHTNSPYGAVAKQMTVRTTGSVAIDVVDSNPRIRTFSVVLAAADPLKYAAGADGLLSYQIGLPTTSGVAGLTMPLSFPLDFGGGISGGRITLTNPGTATAYPQLTFHGPVDTPTLTHTGQGVYAGVSRVLTSTDSVVIDNRLRSLQLNASSSIYGQRKSGTTFFGLTPGRNDLTFSAAAFQALATCTITYRPAWA
jgi:hypothetical protein